MSLREANEMSKLRIGCVNFFLVYQNFKVENLVYQLVGHGSSGWLMS